MDSKNSNRSSSSSSALEIFAILLPPSCPPSAPFLLPSSATKAENPPKNIIYLTAPQQSWLPSPSSAAGKNQNDESNDVIESVENTRSQENAKPDHQPDYQPDHDLTESPEPSIADDSNILSSKMLNPAPLDNIGDFKQEIPLEESENLLDDESFLEHTDSLLENLFSTEIQEEEKILLIPARIIIYLDAFQYNQMASWGVVLIDRISRTALLKSNAHRQGNLERALLQGCIEAIKTLQSQDFPLEIRSRRPLFIHLLQSIKQEHRSTPTDSQWLKEQAFIDLLGTLLQDFEWNCTLIEQDQGIFDVGMIAKESLTKLNEGSNAQVQQRRKFYPLEKLQE